MKYVKKSMRIIFSISLIFISIVTAIELAVYADYGYFEKEYKKYNVNAEDSIVNMDMDELMRVTKEMMSYLRGDREDLIIYAEIDGKNVEFFNDLEKFHMEDVRNLFVTAEFLRAMCVVLMILSATVLALISEKVVKRIAKTVMWSIGIFNTIVIILALIISIDFTSAFEVFHKMFFNNDAWILDPSTDRLINIVPEGFFIDTAIRIVIIYFILNLLNFTIAFLLYRGKIKNTGRENATKNTLTQDGGTYEQG